MCKKDSSIHICLRRKLFCLLDSLLDASIVNAVHHLFCHGLIRIFIMCLLKSVCHKVTGTDMNLVTVIENILYRFLQKWHHMHPENMQTFALRCLFHIFQKQFRILDCLLRTRHEVAHENRVQLIGQARDRIMFFAQCQLFMIICGCLVAVIDRLPYCLFGNLLSSNIF